MAWGSLFELERRRRIRVSVLAYAYEIESDPMATDAEFDALCAQVNPRLPTGNRTLDAFFQTEFAPHTGQWIHKHPELQKVGELVRKIRTGDFTRRGHERHEITNA